MISGHFFFLEKSCKTKKTTTKFIFSRGTFFLLAAAVNTEKMKRQRERENNAYVICFFVGRRFEFFVQHFCAQFRPKKRVRRLRKSFLRRQTLSMIYFTTSYRPISFSPPNLSLAHNALFVLTFFFFFVVSAFSHFDVPVLANNFLR